MPDTTRVRILNETGVSVFASDLELARLLGNRALEQAVTAGYQKGEADACRLLGNTHMRQGQYVEALAMSRRALAIFEQLNNLNGKADALNTIGMVYNQQGQYPLALENFTRALDLRRQIDSTAPAPLLHENIGIVYFGQGDYQQALASFKECYEAYLAMGNEASANKVLVNIGATYNKLKMPQEALTAHEQSLSWFRKSNSVVGQAIAYNNIGSVYFVLGNYPRAIENYQASLGLKIKMNDRRGIAVSQKNIAEAWLALKQAEQALGPATESLKLAEAIGAREQIKDAHEMLSKIQEARGNFSEALHHERMMSQAEDSLFSADKTRQISRMRAIYETEKAEQEARVTRLQADYEINQRNSQRNFFVVAALLLFAIALLAIYLYSQKQRSNKLLTEKNILIERSLAEREGLLQEIHHRVKNNLQIISSLLSLQSKSLQDTDAQAAIQESRNRVKSMSLIHEQLYQEHTMSGVEMGDYIRRLTNSLVSSYGLDTGRVDVRWSSDPMVLDVDTAIPIGLILNELITNAIKYAFPDRQGTLDVSLKDHGDYLLLRISDDGVGLGKGAGGGTSFGLSMVNSLLRKLKGEMTVDQTKGTAFNLVIRDFKKVTFIPALSMNGA